MHKTRRNKGLSLEEIGLDVDTGTLFESFLAIVFGNPETEKLHYILQNSCIANPRHDGSLWIDVDVDGEIHTFPVEKGRWEKKSL